MDYGFERYGPAVTERDGNSKRDYHSHALSRGLNLLRAIATQDTPTTLAALHETTELPKSTLVRLLAVLEDEDYVIRVDERPAYRLGHALLPITIGYFETGSVADLVRPHLKRLAADTGWTANFGILEGSEVLHLCVEFPQRPIHYTAAEGSLAASYCSGLGKALLAVFDDANIPAVVPVEPFAAITPNTLTTRKALLAELASVRDQGFAVDA
jgi:IclR family transcriptional regulator, acetate operon repressor